MIQDHHPLEDRPARLYRPMMIGAVDKPLLILLLSSPKGILFISGTLLFTGSLSLC